MTARRAPDMQRYLPLFVDLRARRVVVLGAGPAVTRKVEELVAARARVDVVAPAATETIRALATKERLTWRRRPYRPGDLAGAWLVVSATADPVVQRQIFEEAARQRVFVLAIDDPRNGSCAAAAVITRPPLRVAIFSAGQAPALSRLMREVLEHALPEQSWVDAARRLRARWRRQGTPMGSRFGELLEAFTDRARSR